MARSSLGRDLGLSKNRLGLIKFRPLFDRTFILWCRNLVPKSLIDKACFVKKRSGYEISDFGKCSIVKANRTLANFLKKLVDGTQACGSRRFYRLMFQPPGEIRAEKGVCSPRLMEHEHQTNISANYRLLTELLQTLLTCQGFKKSKFRLSLGRQVFFIESTWTFAVSVAKIIHCVVSHVEACTSIRQLEWLLRRGVRIQKVVTRVIACCSIWKLWLLFTAGRSVKLQRTNLC